MYRHATIIFEYLFNECILSPINKFIKLVMFRIRVSLGGVFVIHGAEKMIVWCFPLWERQESLASNICVIYPHVTSNKRDAPLM